jgi:hypothetical protein
MPNIQHSTSARIDWDAILLQSRLAARQLPSSTANPRNGNSRIHASRSAQPR